MDDYSYLGSGKIYLREIDAAVSALLEVGNCSKLDFGVTEDVKELKDFTQPGGGTYNEVHRISAVESSFTMHDLSPANLARVLYGGTSAVVSAAVTAELLTVHAGSFTPFANLPKTTPVPTVVSPFASAVTRVNSTAVALNAYLKPAIANGFYYKVTVAGTTNATPPTFPTVVGTTVVDGTATIVCAGLETLVAGMDYEVRPGGIFVLAASAIDGEVWSVGYTKAGYDVVQALTTSGREYELLFDGLNEARSGKRTRVTAYRVKVGAAKTISLIGEDYAALEVTGKLLKDTSKTGLGVSQYFRVEIEA
jgi:hypothetical protein